MSRPRFWRGAPIEPGRRRHTYMFDRDDWTRTMARQGLADLDLDAFEVGDFRRALRERSPEAYHRSILDDLDPLGWIAHVPMGGMRGAIDRGFDARRRQRERKADP